MMGKLALAAMAACALWLGGVVTMYARTLKKTPPVLVGQLQEKLAKQMRGITAAAAALIACVLLWFVVG